MSTYPKVTEQDMTSLAKLAEKPKNRRAEKNRNRILKQAHDMQWAENFAPITKKLTQVFENQGFEDGNTQTPSTQNVIATQALPDSLSFMKTSNFFSN